VTLLLLKQIEIDILVSALIFLILSVMLTPSAQFESTFSVRAQQGAGTVAVTPITNFLTYQNSTYGIKMQYPSDWLYREGNTSNGSVQTIVTFVSPNILTAPTASVKALVGLTIAIQSLPFHNLPLNTYTILNLNNLKQTQPGFQLLTSNDTTLAEGNPAHELTYTAASGLKTLAVYMIKENKAFILEYITGQEATYLTYLPIAQEMIDSFQITK
jgi:hypothetical protein